MKTIGIIGAMDEEVSILLELMEVQKTVNKASLVFNQGVIEGRDIVLVKCGIGKVNAALCAQILISEFGADAIVNTGVAGALNDQLDVNDIVISTDAVEHDFDAIAYDYPKGVIPRMETSVFKADERLIDAAYSSSINSTKHNVFKGRIATGDIFIASRELKDSIVEEFGAYCGEMEGGAIAHVCYLNNTPFVIIRAMSDKADDSANVTYEEFVIEAAHNSKDIVLNMLKSI
ncbi:5'-methylthioadenosine/adenosylhomocysteine nucleosidase [Metaclostridioides mangenotii]|uniref:5'-methylthioadenosine/adenosylhomocysteine nucleosidase n=1 Tax=Metaclostridioides mangenotii TaxID=1540 RepID=UPI0026EA7995|nr:5'-methylthioadenosine/adenosylhomocysteine nucleosidase [Clostridioides mangenotii]